jgi:hypothetical protein
MKAAILIMSGLLTATTVWTAAVLISSCKGPVAPVGGGDAAEPTVCGHLRELGCPEGQPVDGGETCESLYNRDKDQINGACILAAKTAIDVRTCLVECIK